jgi:hypothetical protein
MQLSPFMQIAPSLATEVLRLVRKTIPARSSQPFDAIFISDTRDDIS